MIARIRRWNEEVSWVSMVSECAAKWRIDVLWLLWEEKRHLFVQQAKKDSNDNELSSLKHLGNDDREPAMTWLLENVSLF